MNELATTEDANAQLILATDNLSIAVNAARKELEGCVDDIQVAVATARGIREIENALTDEIMSDFMLLMNTPHGFKTDKTDSSQGFYEISTVRKCLIDAFLKGAKVVGNEFNILVSQCYLTKMFYERKIKELTFIKNLKYNIGLSVTVGPKASAMPGRATWFDERDQQQHSASFQKTDGDDFRIVVNSWDGSSPSELHGKGESRLLRRIYKQITGNDISDEPGGTVDGTVKRGSEVDPPKRVEQEAPVQNELADRRSKALGMFKKINVTEEMLTEKLKKPFEDTTSEDLDDLKAIAVANAKNETRLCDHFNFKEITEGEARNRMNRCKSIAGLEASVTRLVSEGADSKMIGQLSGEYREKLERGE